MKIQITQRCSRIIRGQTCFTGEFIQGYVVALNSTAGMPKDWKAGYDYGTNDWNHNAYDNVRGLDIVLDVLFQNHIGGLTFA